MVSEHSELVGQKHSELLLEMIDSFLQNAGVTISQLDGVAFGKGPGSFTGVRIACGVAQGLALGLNLNVVGVCTLQALAEACGHAKVIAALDARMGEIYLAAYEKQGDEWNTVIAPCLCKIEHAPAIEGGGWFGAGSGFVVDEGALAARYAGHLSGLDAHVVPQAGAVAKLAASEFAKGNAVDAELALPLYLRDKVALKTSER